MTEMPTWEGFMIPVLRVLSDGVVRSRRQLAPDVARLAGLTSDQVSVRLNSGQPMYANRMGWALSFLTNVGGLSRPSRAHYQITAAGREILSRFPDAVSEQQIKELAQDPTVAIRAYVATVRNHPAIAEEPTRTESMTPTEQVQVGIGRINDEVASELLARLMDKEPAFFEKAVVDLLVAMGYGGTGGTAAATQLVNDGGIDGIIDQDVLGLNKVYIQAKRYGPGNSVGRPELQGFVGALSGKADRGVFITTSFFSKGAIEYAHYNTASRLILIDGERLTDLMIRFRVGVQVKDTVHVVEVDEDFFE